MRWYDLKLIIDLNDFSAGVGRTGVFITLSIVLERMQYEGVVDMYQTVKMLRTQRPAMVQTEVSRVIYYYLITAMFPTTI
jgi:protein tyrosine phosphatase